MTTDPRWESSIPTPLDAVQERWSWRAHAHHALHALVSAATYDDHHHQGSEAIRTAGHHLRTAAAKLVPEPPDEAFPIPAPDTATIYHAIAETASALADQQTRQHDDRTTAHRLLHTEAVLRARWRDGHHPT